MGGEVLYERYKDALRRGHVASLHGRLDEALLAYAEASSLAPDRPMPHASAGSALLQHGRPADALRSFETALRLETGDETALEGRALALATLLRQPEAADAFDALADARAGRGALADAVDAARRGLELAEGRERRRILEHLIARLRAADGGEPGRAALERALGVLEGHAVAAGSTARTHDPEAGLAPDQSGEPDTPDEPVFAALDRDLPAGMDLAALVRAAEVARDAGVAGPAVESALDAAAAHRLLGQPAAALDACYGALSVAPADVGLHLALLQLYDDRGWTVLAGQKLDLLERLVTLDGDPAAVAQVTVARAARG